MARDKLSIFCDEDLSQPFSLFLPTKFARTTKMKISCIAPLPQKKKPVCDKQINLNKYGYLSKINHCTHCKVTLRLRLCLCTLFYSSFVYTCVCVFPKFTVTSKVHCGSAVGFGQALLGYLITAHHLYASLM